MSTLMDFQMGRQEDYTLVIQMTPPTPIVGWTLQFSMMKRFGGVSGLFPPKTIGSGIIINNSNLGIFSVGINSVDTSGIEYGNYAYLAQRLDSGQQTNLSEGYGLISP